MHEKITINQAQKSNFMHESNQIKQGFKTGTETRRNFLRQPNLIHFSP
jgi:hypothetical protein